MDSSKKPWPIATVCGIKERIDTKPDFQRPAVNFLNEGEITTQNQSASGCIQLIKSLTPTVAMLDMISDMA